MKKRKRSFKGNIPNPKNYIQIGSFEDWLIFMSKNSSPDYLNIKVVLSIGEAPKGNYWMTFSKKTYSLLSSKDKSIMLSKYPELYSGILDELCLYCGKKRHKPTQGINNS